MKRAVLLALLLIAGQATAQTMMQLGIGQPNSGASVAPGGCAGGALNFSQACNSALLITVGL